MIKPKQLDEILAFMFKLVNEEYTNEYVKRDGWYSQHSWRNEVEEDFRRWLVHYIMEKCHCTKRYAEKQAGWFILNYGWRTDDKLPV